MHTCSGRKPYIMAAYTLINKIYQIKHTIYIYNIYTILSINLLLAYGNDGGFNFIYFCVAILASPTSIPTSCRAFGCANACVQEYRRWPAPDKCG